jgi:hypothetical protein
VRVQHASDDAVGAAAVFDNFFQISRQHTDCLDDLVTFARIECADVSPPPVVRNSKSNRPTSVQGHFRQVIELGQRADVRFDPESDRDRAAAQYVAKGH